ncbi:MAG: UDP-glucose 4-epimerase GalE [Polynucleobacter sp.]|uniref:UDP-glucose 4-epimerase GalE n=1 Tax=Polynucleobacter sp. TaxID=2029855 RepID=UPI0021710593|nr:UDP-glucose 4-epimerase GalE [Polynucleobacter sp.]MBU3670773.1 UDP-glucose 4-epimerase GalE [Polynucleobacter sp.]
MILLTGATGYIGSHTWLELLQAGQRVIGIDNFINSSPLALARIEALAGQKLEFVEGDVCSKAFLESVFKQYPIKGVIHFAALKAVGESVAQPLRYYQNNLAGLLTLLEVMQSHGCKNFVFSSSATVYGDPSVVPIDEQSAVRPTNPYGQTKLMSEQVLRDVEVSDSSWRVAYLRYFNPVGAHESGQIGEDPRGIPNNLTPLVARVAAGRMSELKVYGNDWPTPDGTGVRDYIHVVDLAQAHVKAVEYLLAGRDSLTVNLGTGQGYSVMDVLKAYGEVVGHPIPYQVVERRPGDIATCYADPSLAAKLLGWKASRNLAQMCADSWRWQSQNPMGYES